jgi:hypothetical protein
MTRAGVPPERQIGRTKAEVAIKEIDRVAADARSAACWLFRHGSSSPFRPVLSEPPAVRR